MSNGALFDRIRPAHWDPRIQLHAKAVLKRRRVHEGTRLIFPEPRCARLEQYHFLSPGPGEILFENRCSIVSAGTERTVYQEALNTGGSFPFQPGYASSGVVRAIGAGVTGFRLGDRVATPAGHCSRGVIPARKCTVIPAGVSDEEAAFRQLALIAFTGILQCDAKVGDTIGVVGRGIIGLVTLRLLAVTGGFRLISIGRHGRERDVAVRSGATDLIDTGLEMPPLQGGHFDAIIDATGDPAVLGEATKWVETGGRVVLVGSPRGTTNDLALNSITEQGIEIRGAHISKLSESGFGRGVWTASKAADYVMGLLSEKRVSFLDLIETRLKVAELPEFYNAMAGANNVRGLGTLITWSEHTDVSNERPIASTKESSHRVHATDALSSWLRNFVIESDRMPPELAEAVGTVRFALVGCGTAAAKTARALQLAPSAKLVCAADLNRTLRDGICRRFGIEGENSLSDVLSRPDIDAVFLGTPHPSHLQLAEQCAAAGKHLIVEKPLATSQGDVERLIDFCNGHGVLLSVNYSRRFLPQIQLSHQLIRDGAPGKLLGATILFAQEKRRSYWSDPRTCRLTWRATSAASGGGMLLTTMVHHIDYLFWMTGEVGTYISSTLDTLGSPDGVTVEDSLSMSFRFPEGGIGTIAGSTCCPGGQDYLAVWGIDGQLRVMGDEVSIYTNRPVSGIVPGRWQRLPAVSNISERGILVERFSRAVLNCDEVPVDPRDSIAVARLVDAAYGASTT